MYYEGMWNDRYDCWWPTGRKTRKIKGRKTMAWVDPKCVDYMPFKR